MYIKKLLKKTPFLINPIINLLTSFFGIFYDPKYLKGKYFGRNITGWKWAWKGILWQKVFGFNKNIPWPVSPQIRISSAENLVFSLDDMKNFQTFGCYYQNFSAKIIIGKGTYIAPNVGFITSNHDPKNLNTHKEGKEIRIGKNCWIGMNVILLPGTTLGNNTVVGAGSVVTKSYIEGNVIIAGNPAKIIRSIK
jgi:acetyltransferase-like isoleucine patch superfamily enzyme